VDLTALLLEALQLALLLAVPVLAACAVAGIALSLVQSALHTSDPSLGFVPKWFAALAALWLSYGFLSEKLVAFAGRVFELMARVGH